MELPAPNSSSTSTLSASEDSVAAGLRIAEREFAATLEERGLHAALAYLNARTRYRFTGVYRRDASVMRCVALVDRENPTLTIGQDILLSETYCSHILASCTPFVMGDAGADERVADHPARGVVLSYFGVPIPCADASPLGTLCHFDLRPRTPVESELPLLRTAAAAIGAAITSPRSRMRDD